MVDRDVAHIVMVIHILRCRTDGRTDAISPLSTALSTRSGLRPLFKKNLSTALRLDCAAAFPTPRSTTPLACTAASARRGRLHCAARLPCSALHRVARRLHHGICLSRPPPPRYLLVVAASTELASLPRRMLQQGDNGRSFV
jgi:hypothetical protein